MKNILLISPEPWGTNYVSKHHYAIELAKKGFQVFFLNPPSDTNGVVKLKKGLFIIDYKIRFRGLGFLPKMVSSFLISKDILFLENLIGEKFNIIWNFDSSRFFNLNNVKDKLKVCHIVDMAENIQRNLLAKTSDLCFCTSDFIKFELTPFNKQVYKIHHGYASSVETYAIKDTFNSSKTQVGYVGNLSRPCIDWPSLLRIVKAHPEVDFNFIGAYTASNLAKNTTITQSTLDELAQLQNVHLLGQKDSHLIPSYLDKFDLLLCAYTLSNEADVKQHSNLHKTMEYIGSGKVTVSTYSDEYKDKQSLLEMIKIGGDLKVKFDEVLNNLDHFNSIEKVNQRKEFAKNNTYDKQLDRILEVIHNQKN